MSLRTRRRRSVVIVGMGVSMLRPSFWTGDRVRTARFAPCWRSLVRARPKDGRSAMCAVARTLQGERGLEGGCGTAARSCRRAQSVGVEW